MRIRKAVITAAAPDQHSLPLQRLVDRDGVDKTALQLIVAEAASAGIEEICVVIQPGDSEAYRLAAGPHVDRLVFVEQTEPRGYGHALYQAREFVGDEAFLHLVSDHLYLSHGSTSCARQLVDVATAESCCVSGVEATRENNLPYFGAVGGVRVAQRSDLYEVAKVLEKPTPTRAEQELIVAGLRSGYYLCFFGMHVLTPVLMEALEARLAASEVGVDVTLSVALDEVARRERYLALEVAGRRHDIGVKYGLLLTQLALALAGEDRDEILTELIELLARRGPGVSPDPATGRS